MSIVPNQDIQSLIDNKEITIDPYFETFQGPNCYHCHLGSNFLKLKEDLPSDFIIDPLSSKSSEYLERIYVDDYYLLRPGEFILGETFEYFGTNEAYVIRLLNSSSLARVGISQAALGMINAGCGKNTSIKLTLELINNSTYTIKIIPTKILEDRKIVWGTEVLKVVIEKMRTKSSIAYDDWKFGIYANDKNVAASKMRNRFDDNNLYIDKNSNYYKE